MCITNYTPSIHQLIRSGANCPAPPFRWTPGSRPPKTRRRPREANRTISFAGCAGPNAAKQRQKKGDGTIDEELTVPTVLSCFGMFLMDFGCSCDFQVGIV